MVQWLALANVRQLIYNTVTDRERKQQDYRENRMNPGDAEDNLIVRVLDATTQEITEVPKSSLSPNMMQVQVEGVSGTVWIDSSQLQKGEYKHEPFDETVREHLRTIKKALDVVYPQTLDEWEDGFRRDAHPDREIAIWLHVADVYTRSTGGKQLSKAQQEEVFKVVASCMFSSQDEVLESVDCDNISMSEARQIVETYFTPPETSALD